MGIAEGMGKRNPHQEPDHGAGKSQKICFCITGWILLFENSNPLTYHNLGNRKNKYEIKNRAIRVPVDRQRDLGIYLHEGIKEEQI